MAVTEAPAGDDGDAPLVQRESYPGAYGGAVCVKCRHLYIVNKSDSWWRFLCMQHPRRRQYNPVLGAEVADPPYRWCKDVNAYGKCQLYEEGPNDYQPRKMPT